MSSEMFPFASHGEHGYDLAYAKKELKVNTVYIEYLDVSNTTQGGRGLGQEART